MQDDARTPPQDGAPDVDGVQDPFSPEQRRALTRREPEALGVFFDAFFDRVYGYVRRLVGDEHVAEDLTQDVFFKLYRGFESYDPERELRPWVFAVATNQVRDHWRSRTNRETVSSEVVEADLGVSSADLERDEPGGELERRELAASLRHAVDLLPDAMRMAVLLRVYEGLSFQAIGAALECEEATARKRYSRALEKLRSLVGTAALREEASG